MSYSEFQSLTTGEQHQTSCDENTHGFLSPFEEFATFIQSMNEVNRRESTSHAKGSPPSNRFNVGKLAKP